MLSIIDQHAATFFLLCFPPVYSKKKGKSHRLRNKIARVSWFKNEIDHFILGQAKGITDDDPRAVEKRGKKKKETKQPAKLRYSSPGRAVVP